MGKIKPVVFITGKEYQITLAVSEEAMMWVQIGNEIFYDADNGILRSEIGVRRVSVPCELLDREKNYIVFLRRVRERKAYFSETEMPISEKYCFCPVEKNGEVRAFHIGDVHNHDEAAIKTAKAYGKIDFLILNGDIPNHCDDLDNIFSIYRIASELTDGRIPVVFSRGNHDMRGKYAEHFSKYVPQCDGKFYYTFRLGSLWGLVLDCGEDKIDSHEEYGNTICCHDMRKKETQFIEKVIERAEQEYKADGITTRMVISHIPFTKRFDGIFDIENDTYSKWTALLRESIQPEIILCAHEHIQNIYMPGGEMDAYGQPCPVVVGTVASLTSRPLPETYYAGTGLVFRDGRIEITFIDSDGKILEKTTL